MSIATLPQPRLVATVKRGEHTNAAASQKQLACSKCRVDPYINKMLANANYGGPEDEVDIVVYSNSDIGLSGATRQQTYDKAVGLGLVMLPDWVAPAWCEDYTKLMYDGVFIATQEPIPDGDGGPDLFCVKRYSDHSLLNGCRSGSAGGVWAGSILWAFGRPRK
ncbi:MAG: hypothetical protein A3C50_03985 [Candidatus Staskawiczbacteria bacterium RIFCSPHIGHO2_02_FULL_43_16]|uniref:Uncharacterized protein n=1 Tax=Candidatus Staskawiczbacteria bacterium RIFCSPHIGHO2_01_FULL_41_41 TaxID=1802203 RepID=A0A1G2HS93_9BACT|nr:MAG: hypothetical protein A2822_03870 [Candidatus Staskawiczbacteria bacterium RIFCSPHIGHO2_01_FULL_41_41]OGZ68092.1 MAG: hypothetical protein A3C50_03985 [Candidatus Staskawiczbacteria bacterium RIFCSPHIGHO2_02_FULL_43_16]OGZ74830.1 MAG: hypothetical protein A3A12_03175 [Candidatus Staskawiczbacteria bacterium RIFCSPLOWO2_01_FULL_43_17b]